MRSDSFGFGNNNVPNKALLAVEIALGRHKQRAEAHHAAQLEPGVASGGDKATSNNLEFTLRRPIARS